MLHKPVLPFLSPPFLSEGLPLNHLAVILLVNQEVFSDPEADFSSLFIFLSQHLLYQHSPYRQPNQAKNSLNVPVYIQQCAWGLECSRHLVKYVTFLKKNIDRVCVIVVKANVRLLRQKKKKKNLHFKHC